MEFYPRGNWIVGTPIWVLEDDDLGNRMTKMLCPHPQWKEAGRAKEVNPEDGKEYLIVTEECPVCDAKRLRLLPADIPEEPFDYSIPQTGPWYERLYNLGNFVILVRRYQNNPNVPPSFMTRVETQAGNIHTGIVQLETLLFSPAALEQIADMERMMKLGGPKRYASYRMLKEGRKTREEKTDIQAHAEALGKVVQDIGPESIAAARAIFEAEIEQEAAEMEEYQIQMMEKEVAERKAQIEKRRAGKKPK